MEKTVIELFAGVGGFRIGLNNINEIDSFGKAIEKGNFKFVWMNQWEPSTKVQHAFDCYNTRFPSSNGKNSNIDISLVNKDSIPSHTLLCGGFPCQDYSVAHSLSKEKGIEGKKGVLWWQIRDILVAKKPPFVLLENVDRLLKSPAKQRGRDFGIMLRCLDDLGYGVEWRVINASEYGMPQRRRRVYIFAFNKNTKYYKKMKRCEFRKIVLSKGIFAKTFPLNCIEESKSISIREGFEDIVDVSNSFCFQFRNCGCLIDGNIYTCSFTPVVEKAIVLSDIIEKNVDSHYFLSDEKKNKFAYLRGSKRILRVAPNGKEYYYSEGSMSPYDELDLPGRTMLTSEGSVNRSTHIINDNGKLRILTPVECERLNQFPDNWTNTGMPERRRYFMMGNALVCGIVSRLGKNIEQIIEGE